MSVKLIHRILQKEEDYRLDVLQGAYEPRNGGTFICNWVYGAEQDEGFLLSIRDDHTFESWAVRPADDTSVHYMDYVEVSTPDAPRNGPTKYGITFCKGSWTMIQVGQPDPVSKLKFSQPIEPGSSSGLPQIYDFETQSHVLISGARNLQLKNPYMDYMFYSRLNLQFHPRWLEALESKLPYKQRWSGSNQDGL